MTYEPTAFKHKIRACLICGKKFNSFGNRYCNNCRNSLKCSNKNKTNYLYEVSLGGKK